MALFLSVFLMQYTWRFHAGVIYKRLVDLDFEEMPERPLYFPLSAM